MSRGLRLKVANSLITLSLCLGGSPPSCGHCWQKLLSQVFSLRLAGEKPSGKLKRVRGGKLNTEQTLIVQTLFRLLFKEAEKVEV